MPHFFNSERKYIISTNYKVMYSTLSHQNNLKRLNKKELAMYLIYPRIPFYLLIRNPYDRIYSFYKDKIQNHPMSAEYRPDFEWQSSQKIFFPYLNISKNENFYEIQEKLKSVSFSYFNQLLPQVYLKNRHLRPQFLIGKLKIYKTLSIQIKYRKILKVENPRSLNFLNEELEINTERKYNSTGHLNNENIWSESDINIVNQLYNEDFKRYDYEKR